MNLYLNIIWQFLLGIVAPESLSIDKVRKKETNATFWTELNSRVKVLHPGDMIMIRTPGAFYEILRSASGQNYDHLGIVLENDMFLHIGPPIIRLLPVQFLMKPSRKPVVYRPKLEPEELTALFNSLKLLVGNKYDSPRVYYFIFRLWLEKVMMQRPKTFAVRRLSNLLVGKRKAELSHMICTDAIIDRLLSVSGTFRTAILPLKFDYWSLNSWSMRDIETIHHEHPTLLPIVPLPDVILTNKQEDSSSTSKTDMSYRKMKRRSKWKSFLTKSETFLNHPTLRSIVHIGALVPWTQQPLLMMSLEKLLLFLFIINDHNKTMRNEKHQNSKENILGTDIPNVRSKL